MLVTRLTLCSSGIDNTASLAQDTGPSEISLGALVLFLLSRTSIPFNSYNISSSLFRTRRLLCGSSRLLLQLVILRLRLLQDGDVGVGIVPQSEEVLVLDASLGSVA